MAREATPDIRIQEGLNPAEQPRDIFIQQAAPERSPLAEVAQSLSGLSSELNQWAVQKKAQQNKEDQLRGEAAFHQNNQKGYAEAVREGTVPADKSPNFIQGYKRAQGSTAGFQLETDVGAAYDQWQGKTSSDPAAFDAWFKGTVAGKVTTDDPSILRGLNPHLREIQNKFHDKWQADVTKNTQFTAQASFGALATSTIDAYHKEGLASATGTDTEKLGASVDAIRAKGFEMGLKREDIDKQIVDAITTRAEVHRDPGLLTLLDRASTAGPKLSDTPYGRDRKQATESTLLSLWKTQTAEERTKQDREDKQASQQAKARITEAILKDPAAVLDDKDITTVQKLDGNFKLDLLEWRKKVREGDVAEDPSKVQQLYTDLLSGGGIDRIWGAISAGDLKNPESVAKATAFLKSADEYNKGASKILETAGAKSYLSQIEQVGADSKFSINSILGKVVMTPEGRQALNNYRYGMMQWQTQNPQSSPLEQEEYARKLGEAIMGSMTTGGKYTPPAETRGQPSGASTAIAPVSSSPTTSSPSAPAAPAPATASPASPSSPAPSPTPSTTPLPTTPSGGGGWQERINTSPTSPPVESLGLAPDELKLLNDTATKMGVPPQQLIDKMWQRRPGGGPAQPNPPAEVAPPDERRSEIKLPGNAGSIHLAGLSPEHAAVVQEAVSRLDFPSIPQPITRQEEIGDTVNPKRIAQIRGSAIGPLLTSVATRSGFNVDKLAAMVSVESSGNPNAGAKSPYKGLLQLSDAEWAKYGRPGDNILDPQDNLEAGIKSLQDKERNFAREFGRKPTAVELYLMHQQGEAGLRAHEQQPNAPAWQNMLRTGEGKRKGPGWAKLAVWGNVPSDLKHLFGSVDNMTSKQFLAVWSSKLMGISYADALKQAPGETA